MTPAFGFRRREPVRWFGGSTLISEAGARSAGFRGEPRLEGRGGSRAGFAASLRLGSTVERSPPGIRAPISAGADCVLWAQLDVRLHYTYSHGLVFTRARPINGILRIFCGARLSRLFRRQTASGAATPSWAGAARKAGSASARAEKAARFG